MVVDNMLMTLTEQKDKCRHEEGGRFQEKRDGFHTRVVSVLLGLINIHSSTISIQLYGVYRRIVSRFSFRNATRRRKGSI